MIKHTLWKWHIETSIFMLDVLTTIGWLTLVSLNWQKNKQVFILANIYSTHPLRMFLSNYVCLYKAKCRFRLMFPTPIHFDMDHFNLIHLLKQLAL